MRNTLKGKETLLIGDAESDRASADKVGVLFIARITLGNHQLQDRRWKVNDLNGPDNLFNNMSSC